MKTFLLKNVAKAGFFLGMFAFIFLKANQAGGVDAFFKNLLQHPLEIPLVAAPCIVFGFTVHAYSRFIAPYKDLVPHISIAFLLFALICCMGLSEQKAWWMHLRYMYLLFYSYVVWDIIMLEHFLTPKNLSEKDAPADYQNHVNEIKIVSTYINQPTLITIFILWLYSAFFLPRYNVPTDTVQHFIAGVVCFHLIFSSLAYVFAYRLSHSVSSCAVLNEIPATQNLREAHPGKK